MILVISEDSQKNSEKSCNYKPDLNAVIISQVKVS